MPTPAPVTADLIASVLTDHAADLARPDLTLTITATSGTPTLTCTEYGQDICTVDLVTLADTWTRAGITASTTAVLDAAAEFLDHRPVTDAAAAATGIATVGISATGAPGWQVAVPRRRRGLIWQPTTGSDPATVRAAAFTRAATVPVGLRTADAIAFWTYEPMPMLSTAALVDPDRIAHLLRYQGLDTTDLHVGIRPGQHPMLTGTGSDLRTLTAHLPEECPMLLIPYPALLTLGWLS